MKRPIHPPKQISDEAITWIVRLHSGEADLKEFQQFRSWRSQSPDHEAAASEAEKLWANASELHRDPVTGLIRPGQRRQGVSRRALLGCAGLVAAGGLSTAWLTGAGRKWGADYATGTGQTRLVRLADGSSLTLNARSAVNVEISSTARHIVLLEGQAFFQVASDPARPFSVQVHDVSVIALGTAFDIDMNIPLDKVAITVTRHSVQVESGVGGPIVLGEGERVVLSQGGESGPIENQDGSSAIAWLNGTYVAEGKPLDEVIAALRPYYEGWIVVRGERTRSMRVNAVLDLAKPNASLDALANGLPITVRRISRFLTVVTST
ncbi:MAG: FecR family protein [Mesorhizobium sp.]